MWLTWLILASVFGQAQGVPSVGLPARVAAVEFAQRNGWEFPQTSVILAHETHFGAIDGHPAPQSAAERDRETRQIAALLGPGVTLGPAGDYLRCPSPGVCFAKTENSVITVGGLFVGESDVLIRVYTPGPNAKDRTSYSSVTSAIIELERRGSGWVATKYSKPPATLVRQR